MAGGVITTGSLPRSLKPIVKHFYDKSLPDHPELCKAVFNTVKTEDAYEEFANYYELGAAVEKPQGQALTYDSMKQLYDHKVDIKTYALGFKITYEAIRDQKVLKLVERKVPALKKACMENREIRAFSILNNAFDSGTTYADGKELLATDHPVPDGTQSNELAVAADLSEASLEQLCIDMKNSKNNRNLRINIQPRKLVIPTDLMFEADRILKGKERTGTADRDINALKYRGILQDGRVEVPYLTDADAFFILTDLNEGMEGMIHLEREGMDIHEDNDFDTMNACYAAMFRDAFTVNNWRAIFGSPGA